MQNRTLKIDVSFVFYNVAETLQRELRDHLKKFFDIKNKPLKSVQREPVLILNHENLPLNRVLLMNKNPNFALINLDHGIRPSISKKLEAREATFPDFKVIKQCYRYKYLEKTQLILIGNIKAHLEKFLAEKLSIKATFEVNGVVKEQKIDSHHAMQDILDNLSSVTCLKVDRIFFSKLINSEGTKSLLLETSFQQALNYFWSEVDSSCKKMFERLQHEHSELSRLKKVLLVLPKIITDVVVQKLEAENFKNIHAFENASAFMAGKNTQNAYSLVDYLEKTNYRELALYLDKKERADVMAALLGNLVFKNLDYFKGQAVNLLGMTSLADMQAILPRLPRSFLSSMLKFEITEDAYKIISKGNREIILDYCTTLGASASSSEKPAFSDELAVCLVEELKPLWAARNFHLLDKETRKSLEEEAKVELPSIEKTQAFSNGDWEALLRIFAANKNGLKSFNCKNAAKLASFDESIQTSLIDLLSHHPSSCIKILERRGVSLLAKEAQAQLLKNKGVKVDLPSLLNAKTADIFQYISLHFSSFAVNLSENNCTTVAAFLVTCFSDAEKKKTEESQLQRYLQNQDEKEARMKRLTDYFSDGLNGSALKDAIMVNNSYLIGNYDIMVCLSSEQEVLHRHPRLKEVPTVLISKEIEQTYLDILARERININDQEELFKYITKVTNERLESIKEKEDTEVESYVVESLLLIMKILNGISKKMLAPDIMQKMDTRPQLREKLKQGCAKKIETVQAQAKECKEQHFELKRRSGELSGRQQELVQKGVVLDRKLDISYNEIQKKERSVKDIYSQLSRIAQSQRVFSKKFARLIINHLFPNSAQNNETGEEIFGFNEQQKAVLQNKAIYIATNSHKLTGFIKFCLRNDKLPESLLPSGSIADTPQNLNLLAIDPNIGQQAIEALKKKHPEAEIFSLNLEDHQHILDIDERRKRVLREEYIKSKDEQDKLKAFISQLLQIMEQFDSFFDKIEDSLDSATDKIDSSKARMLKIKQESIEMVTKLKVIFSQLDKIDLKLSGTMNKVQRAINNSENQSENLSMETIAELSDELIQLYGGYDLLLLINKFSKMVGQLMEEIKQKILDGLDQQSRIMTPLHLINDVIIICDRDQASLEGTQILHSIAPSMIGINPKKVKQIKFYGASTDLSSVTFNSIVFVLIKDKHIELKNLMPLVLKLNSLTVKNNIVIFTEFPNIDLESGDTMKNELAMNINTISNNAILLNTAEMSEEKQLWYVMILYHLLNIDNNI